MSGTVPLPIQLATTGAFAGVPIPTLQLWLLEAQTALQRLLMGGQAVTLSYAQGDGSRSVTYTAGTQVNLRMYIASLQVALGMPNPRRSLRPLYL